MRRPFVLIDGDVTHEDRFPMLAQPSANDQCGESQRAGVTSRWHRPLRVAPGAHSALGIHLLMVPGIHLPMVPGIHLPMAPANL
ncbi:hypothetical protein [Salinicola sp. MH3R3-1]|uniref:hypothetical protein n=1 Tax=Salinicola sp. MH3R3-1 TaxID=1928762 RepID=UPI00111541F1|nr:hypothetical protein [Salinicola sp. MH3R3-1]